MSNNPILEGIMAGAGLAQRSAQMRQDKFNDRVRADQFDRGLAFKKTALKQADKHWAGTEDRLNDRMDQEWLINNRSQTEAERRHLIQESQGQQKINETVTANRALEEQRDRDSTKQGAQWLQAHTERKRQWQDKFDVFVRETNANRARITQLDSDAKMQQGVDNEHWLMNFERISKLSDAQADVALRQMALREKVDLGKLKILQDEWKLLEDESYTSLEERILGSNTNKERDNEKRFALADQNYELDKQRLISQNYKWKTENEQNAQSIAFDQAHIDRNWAQALDAYETNKLNNNEDRAHQKRVQELAYQVERENAAYNQQIRVSAQEKRQAYEINSDLYSLRTEPKAFVARVNEYAQKHPEQFSLLLDESISEMSGGARTGESIDGTGRFTSFALSADGESVLLGNAENGSMYTGATDPDAPGVRENQGTPVAIPVNEFMMQVMRRMNAAGEHPGVAKEVNAYDVIQKVKNFESPQTKSLGRQQGNVQQQIGAVSGDINRNHASVTQASSQRRQRNSLAQTRSDNRNPKQGKMAKNDWQSTFADQDGWVFNDSAEDLASNTKILTKLAAHDPVAALKGIQDQQAFVDGRIAEGASNEDMKILRDLKTKLASMKVDTQRDVRQQRGIGDSIRPEEMSLVERKQLSRYARLKMLKSEAGKIQNNMLVEKANTQYAKENIQGWLGIYDGSPKEVVDNFTRHGVLKTGSYYFDMTMQRLAEAKASSKAEQNTIVKFMKEERKDGRKYVDGFKKSDNPADVAFYKSISGSHSMRLPNFNRTIAETLRRGHARLYHMDKNAGGYGDVTLDESGSLTQLSSLGYFMRDGDWSDNAINEFKQVNSKFQSAYNRLGYEKQGIGYLEFTGKITERLGEMTRGPNKVSKAEALNIIYAELSNGQQ